MLSSRRVAAAAFGFGVAAAVPVAVSPTWGWIGTFAVAAAGAAWLAARFSTVRAPVERLADLLRPAVEIPDASAADLARIVALEFRDAVTRLAEVSGEARRREAALAHAADGVVLVDAEGRVEYANPAARSLLHERVLDITRRLSQPALERLVQQACTFGAPRTEELTIRLPAEVHTLARAVPLGDGSCVLLLSDLSEAYRIDKVRRDFVANVSHELKTPAAGIRALSEVATSAFEAGDPQAARSFMERLGKEAVRLSKLIEDLLDLSRVEAGETFEKGPVDVGSIVADAVARNRPIAELKGMSIEPDCDEAVVEADAGQLSMAIHNLVENAVAYSDGGSVSVKVRSDREGVTIQVSDEGRGIPTHELPRIFERFYRVDKARSRLTGGTGLGLAIVRHVALNHGGRVDVWSELGRGSMFTLTLPGATAVRDGVA